MNKPRKNNPLFARQRKVAPAHMRNIYIELHKLDYQRRNLKERLENLEIERKELDYYITYLSSSMQEILSRSDIGTQLKQEGEKIKLKY